MKLHQSTTKFNCGIDLHARSMYACVMNREGHILLHRKIKDNDFEYFLTIVKPYRGDLTIACESTFNWYWLYDACSDADIPFVLGHALYMRAIHGTKSKNDKVDSEKIAHMLRTNSLPAAYTCRRETRPARDLMRRRSYFVRQRAALLAHMSAASHVDGLTPLSQEEARKRNREHIPKRHSANPLRQLSIETDVILTQQYDQIIEKIEFHLKKDTRTERGYEFNLLMTIPGIGNTCALHILYEIDDIERFQSVGNFCSYSLVTPAIATSDGKKCGSQGRKMGNAYLKWVLGEAAVHGKRHNSPLRRYVDQLEKSHGARKARRIVAHKLARAIYFMLKRREPFDLERFVGKHNMNKK